MEVLRDAAQRFALHDESSAHAQAGTLAPAVGAQQQGRVPLHGPGRRNSLGRAEALHLEMDSGAAE